MDKEFKRYLKLYKSIDFSLHTITNTATVNNYFETNNLKSPDKIVTDADSLDEFQIQGIGLYLGGETKYCALDIDGCKNEAILSNILKILGLPENYQWIIKSGSGVGYHIIYQCRNYRVIREQKVTGFEALQSIGPDFGNANTNAYFPDQANKCFYKMEFKWFGNLVLPPSLHITGGRYEFLREIPEVAPKNVSIYDLYKLKELYTSVYAESSEVGTDFKVRKTDLAYADTYDNNYNSKRQAEWIIISRVIQKVQHNVFEPKRNHYLIGLSWMVVNKNFNVLKRKTFNYLKRDTRYYELDFESNLLLEPNEKYSTLKPIRLEEGQHMLTDSRNVYHELLFDSNHVNRIITLSKDELFEIKEDVNSSGLYLDSFFIPTSKPEYLRSHDYDEVEYTIGKEVISFEEYSSMIIDDLKGYKNINSDYLLFLLYQRHLNSHDKWKEIELISENEMKYVQTLGPDNDDN